MIVFVCLFIVVEAKLSLVSSTILPPLPSFLRGYNSSSFILSAVLQNVDPFVDIITLTDMSSQNFLVSTFLSIRNGSYVNMSSQDVMPVINMPINPSLPLQGIPIASNLTFNVTFPYGLLVPRQQCSQWIWFCLKVYPGISASYKLPAGYSLIQCVNISSLVNCAGNIFFLLFISTMFMCQH